MSADGGIVFKEWLPDLPELNNPGLIEAYNTIRVDGVFKSFSPPFSISSTMGATAGGRANGMHVMNWAGVTDEIWAVYDEGSSSRIYLYDTGTSGWTAYSTAGGYNAGDPWRFAQYEDLLIGTNGLDNPVKHTRGSVSTFSDLSADAPSASHIDVIGQFVVLGGLLSANSAIQWSGIDAPTSWPAPASTTAIAQQSGRQYFSEDYGPVTGIVGGDQYGLIFQTRAITRATYVGGTTVFQFDMYADGIGAFYPRSIVTVGKTTYFISDTGFYATDGVNVTPIGDGKVDRYFLSHVGAISSIRRVCGAADVDNKLIYWSFPDSSATNYQPNNLIIYNFQENVFTRAAAVTESLIGAKSGGPYMFDASNRLCTLTGTPGTAIFTTGEVEPNPGGFAFTSGIKPVADVTVNALTVALGTRNDLATAASFTSETTANSRSRYADFRSESRYQRVRVTISGTFNSAQGIEYLSRSVGDV